MDASTVRRVAQHPLNHAMQLVLPDGHHALEAELAPLTGEGEYWHVRGSLATLLTAEIVMTHIQHGAITAMSITAIDGGGSVALVPRGRLLITCAQQTYEALGLPGLPSTFAQGRFCVAVDLVSPSNKPGGKGHARLGAALEKIGAVQLLMLWQRADGTPVEPAFPEGVGARRLQVQRAHETFHKLPLPNLAAIEAKLFGGADGDPGHDEAHDEDGRCGDSKGGAAGAAAGLETDADGEAATSAVQQPHSAGLLGKRCRVANATTEEEGTPCWMGGNGGGFEAQGGAEEAEEGGAAEGSEEFTDDEGKDDVWQEGGGEEGAPEAPEDSGGLDCIRSASLDRKQRQHLYTELHSWFGLMACSARAALYSAPDPAFPHASSMSLRNLELEPFSAGTIHTWTWKGIISSNDALHKLREARDLVAAGTVPWAALTVWGFEDAPISWCMSEHDRAPSGGENDFTVLLLPAGSTIIHYAQGEFDTFHPSSGT